MDNIDIENTISDLRFFREKLCNGIYGEKATSALTNAIVLLRELESLKQSKGG